MDYKEEFTELVFSEVVKQDEKWGFNRDHHPLEWISILSEEVGEVTKEINDSSFSRIQGFNYEKEIIQCAAVLFQMYKNNQRNIINDEKG